jgi:hypothetical protein
MSFWDMKSCTLVGCYQRFGGTYCLNLQVGGAATLHMGAGCSPKSRKLPHFSVLM